MRADGYQGRKARAFATIVLPSLRGFMQDYCATGDRERLDRAVDLWLPTLDLILRDGKEA
jgi:hypothetical protein